MGVLVAAKGSAAAVVGEPFGLGQAFYPGGHCRGIGR
jgi:hypothetical protein